MKEFLKNTIVGGAVFLLPVALVAFILSRALRLTKGVAEPLAKGCNWMIGQRSRHGCCRDPISSDAGPRLLRCGFRRPHGCRQADYPMVGKFLARQSAAIPSYEEYGGRSRASRKREWPEAGAVSIEDGWQIAYQIEQLENNWVVVFLHRPRHPCRGTSCIFRLIVCGRSASA